MPTEKQTTLLGVFVIGAIVILFSFLYFYYTQKTLIASQTYVMLFKGSLGGLRVGSPITYRGIRIGQVTGIRIKRIKNTDKIEIPVYAQFFTSRSDDQSENPIYYLIQTGWVADISSPNLVSGQSTIILKRLPGVRVQTFSRYEDYAVFPTIQNPEGGSAFDRALESAQQAFVKITNFIQSKKLEETMNNGSHAMAKFNEFMTKLNNQTIPILANFNSALIEVKGMAREHKTFTEYLSRHPEALIKGKQH